MKERENIINELKKIHGDEAVEDAIAYGGLHQLLDEDDSDPQDAILYAFQCI